MKLRQCHSYVVPVVTQIWGHLEWHECSEVSMPRTLVRAHSMREPQAESIQWLYIYHCIVSQLCEVRVTVFLRFPNVVIYRHSVHVYQFWWEALHCTECWSYWVFSLCEKLMILTFDTVRKPGHTDFFHWPTLWLYWVFGRPLACPNTWDTDFFYCAKNGSYWLFILCQFQLILSFHTFTRYLILLAPTVRDNACTVYFGGLSLALVHDILTFYTVPKQAYTDFSYWLLANVGNSRGKEQWYPFFSHSEKSQYDPLFESVEFVWFLVFCQYDLILAQYVGTVWGDFRTVSVFLLNFTFPRESVWGLFRTVEKVIMRPKTGDSKKHSIIFFTLYRLVSAVHVICEFGCKSRKSPIFGTGSGAEENWCCKNCCPARRNDSYSRESGLSPSSTRRGDAASSSVVRENGRVIVLQCEQVSLPFQIAASGPN